MSLIQVPPDNIAVFRVAGIDAGGIARAITGTATIDSYTAAYLAKNAGGQLMLITRPAAIPAPGASVPAVVTIQANDAQGNPLPPLALNFQLNGPPPPPNADHLVISEGPIVRDKLGVTIPPDPGAASIPL